MEDRSRSVALPRLQVTQAHFAVASLAPAGMSCPLPLSSSSSAVGTTSRRWLCSHRDIGERLLGAWGWNGATSISCTSLLLAAFQRGLVAPCFWDPWLTRGAPRRRCYLTLEPARMALLGAVRLLDLLEGHCAPAGSGKEDHAAFDGGHC